MQRSTVVEEGPQPLGGDEERRIVFQIRLPRTREVDRLDPDDTSGSSKTMEWPASTDGTFWNSGSASAFDAST